MQSDVVTGALGRLVSVVSFHFSFDLDSFFDTCQRYFRYFQHIHRLVLFFAIPESLTWVFWPLWAHSATHALLDGPSVSMSGVAPAPAPVPEHAYGTARWVV